MKRVRDAVRGADMYGRKPDERHPLANEVASLDLASLVLCVPSSMTLPREVIPDRFYMITRRCTQQQFLLRPDAETNNAFTYCLAEAAQRFGIVVMLTCAMSNHHHTVIYDPRGTVIEFVEHFHKMFAKCQNVLRGRSENMWASRPVSIVRLADNDGVIDRLVYTATNPVKDRLVERVCHWPGVNGFSALVNQRPLRARRPHYFFRDDGTMPETATLHLVIPPKLGNSKDILRTLRKRVAEVEKTEAAERRKNGRRVLGRGRVRRQSWRDSPKSDAPRRGMNPRVAARDKWARMEALMRNRVFLADYRIARAALLAGTPIPFPIGTYWLRRFVGVPIVAAQN